MRKLSFVLIALSFLASGCMTTSTGQPTAAAKVLGSVLDATLGKPGEKTSSNSSGETISQTGMYPGQNLNRDTGFLRGK